MVVDICDPSIQEEKGGGSQVQVQQGSTARHCSKPNHIKTQQRTLVLCPWTWKQCPYWCVRKESARAALFPRSNINHLAYFSWVLEKQRRSQLHSEWCPGSMAMAFIHRDELMEECLWSWEKNKTGRKMGSWDRMALGAKQGLPSSSKAPGPEECTDWSTDEDCDPADGPVVGHDPPLLMCFGVSPSFRERMQLNFQHTYL